MRRSRRIASQKKKKKKALKVQDRKKLKRKRKKDEEESEKKDYPRKRQKVNEPVEGKESSSLGAKSPVPTPDVEMEDKIGEVEDVEMLDKSQTFSQSSSSEEDLADFSGEESDDEEIIQLDDVEVMQDGEMFGGYVAPVQRYEKTQVVNEVAMIREQQKNIMDVAEALNVSVGVAGQMLKYFKWNMEMLYQEFFENKEQLIKKANISVTNVPFVESTERYVECPVCYDDYAGSRVVALPCRHFFCMDCWKSYLKVQIDDGATCLMCACPYLGCKNIVTEELMKKVFGSDTKEIELYNRYLVRSFVDDNPKIKWCPAPDCGNAVLCGEPVQNVECSCGQKFCFRCQQEAHEPCSCEDLRKWKIKERDESETANWLTVNTKLCPNCEKAIEKNGGCNHMTCSQCKHEFCWICNDSWKEHGSKTGGFYKCNRYKKEELDEKLKSSVINDARAHLEKYMHYFKRYANHFNSQKFEIELKKKSEKKMEKLQRIHKYSSWSDVEYIQEAIANLIECRRVLKYTYIHGYYLTDEGNEKGLFEFLQQDLEKETERLSGLLEMEIEDYKKDDIMNSTKVAKKRLVHLLDGVRVGLLSGI